MCNNVINCICTGSSILQAGLINDQLVLCKISLRIVGYTIINIQFKVYCNLPFFRSLILSLCDNTISGIFTIHKELTVNIGIFFQIKRTIINDSSYVTKNQETGEYNVVLSVSEYRGETIKFAVKAKSTVESISIERFPNKTAFAKGAEFDLNGLKVVKTYKNKKTAPVDIDKELKVTGYDMNSVSAQTVTLQYIADDRYSDDDGNSNVVPALICVLLRMVAVP